MRIVYMLTSLGMGGAEKQVLALASRMKERGHGVKLLILRPPVAEQWPTELLVVHLGMHRNLVSVMAGFGKGLRFLDEDKTDIVHSHSFHPNILARLLHWQARTWAISTVHNVYEGGWHRMLAYRLTDGLADCTTAVSQAAADRFIELKAVPRAKCVVVTNGIDTQEFVPDADRRSRMRAEMGAGAEFIWLSSGRIVPAKDIPNLLRAFAQARAERPAVQLWIAGEMPGGNAIASDSASEAAAAMGPVDGVSWLGLRRDLPALLDAADGFVLASAWEGMPLAVGEAMAMEKPVVATDVGGVRELVGDAGVIAPPRDSNTLARAMIDVMQRSKEARSALGNSARMRIQSNFSMDARADDWEALYQSILDGKD